ncbi:MAG: hypothetical protein JSS32_09020 [Verrucomicrobia bacterium]|nr:hypothetical protein [Verrucomicrobiota bacterium]
MNFGLIRTNFIYFSLASALGIAPLWADDKPAEAAAPPKEGYTINYNTLSIIEYIRFAGKICGVNFIFDETDLDFNVTVVSEGPITPKNVMATLVQVLRIHGLVLLEQDNNLVIHKNSDVRQIATIVTDGVSAGNAPIVTRLFRIKTALPDSIAAIIRPMLSKDSILDVSSETRQLILTDVTANVDKVAALIENLDAPHTKIEIRTYEAKFNSPEMLINMASQIMDPLAQGTPFIMVPQPLANTIHIVSTAELDDRAVTVLTGLDTPAKKNILTERKLQSENIFVYKIEHATGDEMIKGLQNIAAHLQQAGSPDPDLIQSIESAKLIRDTNSILFIANKSSTDKLREFLNALDVPSKTGVAPTSFFIFRPQNRSAQDVQSALVEMADNLKGTKGADEAVIETMESVKVNPLTNTLSFSGDERTFNRVRELLSTIDIPGKVKVITRNNFYVYKIQQAPADEIESSLKDFAKSLEKSHANEDGIVETIGGMKYIKETNSILFTGSDASLKRLQDLLPIFDKGIAAPPPVSSQFYIYKPRSQKGEQLLTSIRDVADNLKSGHLADPGLLRSLQSVKWVKTTNSLLFTGDPSSLKRIEDLLATLDVSSGPRVPEKTFFLFTPQYATQEKTEAYLKEVVSNLNRQSSGDLIDTIQSAKWIEPSRSFMFNGDQTSISRVQELLKTFDNPASAAPKSDQTFFLYPLQYATPEKTESYFKQVENNLDKRTEGNLIQTIDSMKWIEPSHSFMFNGDQASIARIQDLLKTFDTPGSAVPKTNQTFVLYPLQYVSHDNAEGYLKQVRSNLNKQADADLIETIDSVKWIEPSHSLMFNGAPSSIARVQDLLKNFDSPQGAPKPNFFLYQPQFASREKTENYLKQVADHLNKQTDDDLITTIKSMKWIEPSHSFMFTGSTPSIARLQDLLKTFDNPTSAAHTIQKGFYLYKLQFVPSDKTENYIDQLAQSLEKRGTDPDLVEALKTRKWMPDSHSFLFSGNEASLNKIKDILSNYDVSAESAKPAIKPGYYIYKLQNTTGDLVEEDLDSLSKNMKQSGMGDSKLVKVIDNMRYVKETNSLLLTGDPQAIEEAKELIAKYDYARPSSPSSNNFYLYKPQNVKAPDIEKSLRDIAANLKRANLADPTLLSAIDSMKYVESTNSIIFTGTPDALQKIQVLIKDIDVPAQKHAPIQHIGKTTFLLYKLQNASGPQIVTSIKAITSDLKKSGTSDKEFLAALNSMKYVKETNSLLFTGTEEALTKAQALVEKFDVTSLAAPVVKEAPPAPTGPGNFYVYKTQSLSGPELEKLLQDFAENLRSSGLNDPDLFNTIQSVRWVEKTQSLIFTGTEKSLDQVKELLKNFDIPANLPEGPAPANAKESSIQAIDNTSFLVYKLQFHKGDEIQGALRQIAKDLIISNAPVNQNLLNSINSIQWLEVTNSLLCSGDQETLTRLRELIKNLDIPLKQVFIEMLVIQTSMNNALTFGLEWGSKYKYRDKFSGSVSNLIPPNASLSSGSGTTGTVDSFSQAINNMNPSGTMTTVNGGSNGSSSSTTVKTPNPQLIPFVANGFDLGIIGEVIRHNGDTFLTLGSLLNALQTESETSVIMNPKLITQDSKTSSIFVGLNVPFAGSFVNNIGNNTVNTSNIEYRDIGMSLTITPVLGNSDIVTLDIAFDQSSTVSGQTGSISTTSGTSTTLSGVTTSKTTMQTTVHVPDQNFLILSGFVNANDNRNATGLPCLGGLPLIGAAFSTNNRTYNDTNVVIFIRPQILNSLDDMKKVSKEQEDFFREQSGTPFLQHNFEEAMEIVKTVDDE